MIFFKKIILILFLLPLSVYSQSGRSKKTYVYVSKVPKPKYPSDLIVYNVKFIDNIQSKNNILDAKEKAMEKTIQPIHDAKEKVVAKKERILCRFKRRCKDE